MQMNLKILSPEEIIVDKSADFVHLKMESGSVGILPGHIPLAGKIRRSLVKFKRNNEEEQVKVDEGYAVVMPDSVTVFTAKKQQ